MLGVIRETIVRATVVFVDFEDEHLAIPILRAVQRQVLDRAEVTRWIGSFAWFDLPHTYLEWLHRKINIKHFIRSLYFRSLNQGAIESFELAPSQIL